MFHRLSEQFSLSMFQNSLLLSCLGVAADYGSGWRLLCLWLCAEPDQCLSGVVCCCAHSAQQPQPIMYPPK